LSARRVDERAVHPELNTACDEMSSGLWFERGLLVGLVCKLRAQRLVLDAGRREGITRSCREIDLSLEVMSSAGLLRAVRVGHLAAELGLCPLPSLSHVAKAVCGPWKEDFVRHRWAFRQVTDEIAWLAADNRLHLGRPAGAPLALAAAGGYQLPAGEMSASWTMIDGLAARSLDRVIAPSLSDFLR
jgi:hypothetical protein